MSVTQPQVQIIGDVLGKLNPLTVEKELQTLETMQNIVPNVDDYVGMVHAYPLWNKFGDNISVSLLRYEGAAKITDLGMKLNYISEMVTNIFEEKFLKLCRIIEVKSSSYIFPHRDYYQDCKPSEGFFTRIHIPLKTQPKCWHSYEEKIYRMKFGEIWLHDDNCVHGAGNLSSESRFHLILDFAPNIPWKDLFKDKNVLNSTNKLEELEREKFSNDDLDDLLNLAKVINNYNYKEIVSLLTKIHFYKKVNCRFGYDLLEKITEKTGNLQLIEKSKAIKNYFFIEKEDITEEEVKKTSESIESIWYISQE